MTDGIISDFTVGVKDKVFVMFSRISKLLNVSFNPLIKSSSGFYYLFGFRPANITFFVLYQVFLSDNPSQNICHPFLWLSISHCVEQ